MTFQEQSGLVSLTYPLVFFFKYSSCITAAWCYPLNDLTFRLVTDIPRICCMTIHANMVKLNISIQGTVHVFHSVFDRMSNIHVKYAG